MRFVQHMPRLLITVVLIALLAGCTSGGSEDSSGGADGSSNLNVSKRSLSATSNGDGRITFSFNVPNSEAAFQLLTFPGSNQIRLISLSNTNGPVSLTPLDNANGAASALQSQVNALQVPFTPDNLVPGNYTAVYELIDAASLTPLADTEVSATLVTKKDNDLGRGTARVNFILVDPLGGSEELRDSLEAALEIVRSKFSSADISLDVQWSEAAGPNILPNPRENDAFYEALTSAARPQSVNIVFGSDVIGLASPNDQYTVSLRDGGIAVPNSRAVGVVSIFAVAGTDGRFNYEDDEGQQIVDDEIQLAGDEIAQLIAHFLGLSHIVENDGGNTTGSDALSDTKSCLTLTDCKIEKDIRGNLMFPFPIFIDGTDMDFYKRSELTEQQKILLQRSVLVD